MIQSVNFPIAKACVAPYGTWAELERKVRAIGLDGVEAIADPDDLDESFPPSLLSGYHMTFYPDWLDFWRHDEAALLRKFRSWETIVKIYRGRMPEDLMRQFREDLALAISLGTPYVVFHVSDVSLEEGFTYRWLHTDEEVLAGAVEFINELLKGVTPSFDFLVENQWWPGFTFTDPSKTEYLLSHIDYPRVGIMLDTGHLMNANQSLRTQSQGISYIISMIQKHGLLSNNILGLHFHQSLSGSYVRKTVGQLPADFPEEYLPAFLYSYPHIQSIDRHHPWTDSSCIRIIESVGPKYLTHELSSRTNRSLLEAVSRQMNTIRRGALK